MRRTRLALMLLLGLFGLAACGRDDYRHDGDHMNEPAGMNHDRSAPAPAK